MTDVNTIELDTLVKENEWIEKELFQEGTVENSIWASNSPKRDLITRWANNLEKLHEGGMFEEDVNTISSFISKKLRSAGMNSAIFYVHDVLDYKYKNSNMNRSVEGQSTEFSEDEPHKNSSIENTSELNKNYIKLLDRTIAELIKDSEKLKKGTIIEPEIPPKEAEQFFLTWNHFLLRHREAWDGREKVLSTNQYIMGYCLSAFSLNHAYTKYLKYAKEKLTLTPKQAGKLLRLQVKKVQEIFNPKNMEEALDLGFYGQQCDKCGSWRTVRKSQTISEPDQLYCYAEHDKNQGDSWTPLRTMKITEVQLN